MKHVYIYNYCKTGFGSGSRRCHVGTEFVDSEFRLRHIGGGWPELSQVFHAFVETFAAECGMKDLDEHLEEVYVVCPQRTDPFRFYVREGMSGAQDIFLEHIHRDGFPRRKFIMHLSMYDKLGGLTVYVTDLADYFVRIGWLYLESADWEGRVYRMTLKGQSIWKDMRGSLLLHKSFSEEDLSEEAGWHSPTWVSFVPEMFGRDDEDDEEVTDASKYNLPFSGSGTIVLSDVDDPQWVEAPEVVPDEDEDEEEGFRW